MSATNPGSRSKASPPLTAGSGGHEAKPMSRYEKFASTQASADGIQGDAKKASKTVEEKIASNMADRK